MSDKYFHKIVSSGTADSDIAQQHHERLENYRKYGWAGTNEEVKRDRKFFLEEGFRKMKDGRAYELEVHHMNTINWTHGHTVKIYTELCCSDEYEEEKEE